MLTKLNFYIIILPFLTTFFLSILFLFFQIFSKKKYLFNLLFTFCIALVFILLNVYFLFTEITSQQIFYAVFVFLCNAFIFVSLVQLPISSLQLTILRIVDLNPGISKKKILKKYDIKKVFDERIKRLLYTDVIYQKKSFYYLKDARIFTYLKILLVLKRIFGIKN